MEPRVQEGRARLCLAVLCGLPGAGKTTLCHQLCRTAPEGIYVSHLSFDGVEKEHVAGLEVVDSPPDGGGIAFDAARWKAARAVAFERLRSLLAASEAGPGSDGFRLVLADDNMYYRSMRHRCFRLANDSRASVVTIHVACDLETALSRNSGRQGVDHVPPAAIRRMAATFEAPGTTEFQQPVIRWEAGQEAEELWRSLLEAWGPPPPDANLIQEQREAARAAGQAANDASIAHAMDLRYRAAIGEVLAALCMSGLAGEAKAAGARRLNEQRRRVLEACRRGSSDPDALEAEEAAFGWLCDDLLAEGEAHDSE